MNGRFHNLRSLLSLSLVCTAMLGGCAVGDGSEDPSETSLDSLIDGDGDPSTSEASSNEGEEAADRTVHNTARTAPTRNTRAWAEGEPRPIPWHEKTQGSEGNSEPNAVDETPHPPAPASPSDGR